MTEKQVRPTTFARKETKMGLLDTVLDNTARGISVIGENHNRGSINVDPGDVDNGIRGMLGIWDAAEMGISKEEVERRFAEANTPEAREKILNDLRERALRRASLDFSNGRVSAAFAGKPGWHGLGIVVNRLMKSGEAIDLGNMNWLVAKVPLRYAWGDDIHENPDSFAIVREDTGAYLGTVGPLYQPMQNRMAFEYVDGVMEEFGARYESVGSVYGGRKIWLLAELPKHRFSIDGDENFLYALFTNPHDGGSAKCFPTSTRAECANTLRLAAKDSDKGISIRHVGSLKAKMEEAKRALGLSINSFEQYKENAETLARTPCDVKEYASDVLEAVLEVTAAEAMKGADALAAALKVSDAHRELAAKKFTREIKRRENILEDILSRYDSGRCHPQGTAWGSLQSVTEHADHNTLRKVKGDTETKLSRRLESILGGERDQMKQVAYEKALAMAL